MTKLELPETVRQAWGPEVAQDFTEWLAEQLDAASLNPPLQISALVARQKVNVLVLTRVSNLLLAGTPKLVQKSEAASVWRVPVDLTFPGYGRVGQVGELEVDALRGEIHYTEALLAQLQKEAERLANQYLPG